MIRHASLLAALAALVSGCAQVPLPAVPSVSTAVIPTSAADKSLNATADGLMSTQPPELRQGAFPPGAGGDPAGTATPAGSAWQYGQASYYAEGTLTASGERFNPDGLTAAHRTLKFGTRIRVCRVSGVRACVYARVNDRGPFVAGRVLDLSRGAMRAIGGISAGVVSVQWAVVG